MRYWQSIQSIEYGKYAKKALSSFSFRLYMLYFLMVGGAAWFIATRALHAIDVSINQAAEEILVDTANLLAAQISFDNRQQGDNAKKISLDTTRLQAQMPLFLQRQLNAKIYQHLKTETDLHVYVTDVDGKVLYDSSGQAQGKDYSRWKDVKRTLSGQYGARVSPMDYSESSAPLSEKGLFVAAPIYATNSTDTVNVSNTNENTGNNDDDINENADNNDGHSVDNDSDNHADSNTIIGVLTVVKSNKGLGDYVIYSNRTIILYALAAFAIALLTGAFITWWLWRSIRKLSRYAHQLGRGQSMTPPKIIHSEFKPLAAAMQSMYRDLEGKEYVENYIHTMAHELKSPLTGMIATTELLRQDLPDNVRHNFIDNIHDSATRMTALIERLLQLAAVENRHDLATVCEVNLGDCVAKTLADYHRQCEHKQLTVNTRIADNAQVRGEPTLITQSFANLFDNAVDFSPVGASIDVTVESDDAGCRICVRDHGAGIAEFAQKRLFERFFSTPRPDSQQRSSGLGLAFVKEVMTLHQGTVTLQNHSDGGAVAVLVFPA